MSDTEEIQAIAEQTEKKAINVADYRLHDTDTGSAQYQIAKLTITIFELTDHLKTHKKDHSSRRGLLRLVARRRKFLDYIRKGSEEEYKKLITGLGLRK